MIKDFFLNYREWMFNDCVVKGSGNVDLLDEPKEKWSVTLIDTGLRRSIGERLWAIRDRVCDEEMFLANYADGLTDVNLDQMIARFKNSNKVACFLAVRPRLSFHVVDIATSGAVEGICSIDQCNLWLNGGYFVLRPEIFDYMREGEELVEEPFRRLIEADKLMAYKHEGFWRGMDTLKDKDVLEDMINHGEMPWNSRRPQPTPQNLAECGLQRPSWLGTELVESPAAADTDR
jgi:glucose-1-phosphate cytidylyltransferase